MHSKNKILKVNKLSKLRSLKFLRQQSLQVVICIHKVASFKSFPFQVTPTSYTLKLRLRANFDFAMYYFNATHKTVKWYK